MDALLEKSALGKETAYFKQYDPKLLFSISRETNRQQLQLSGRLPFNGVDIWNAYEFSWLNAKGKPQVAILEIEVPCTSPNVFESKSLKLYLNAFSNIQFSTADEIVTTITSDLSAAADQKTKVTIKRLTSLDPAELCKPIFGIDLDNIDVVCNCYQIDPMLLKLETAFVTETLYSNLLKSNCPVTNQPDWGSVVISYTGKKINHAALLQYIVSFRDHCDFQEHCIERIFMDLYTLAKPTELTVYGRYTRRGGIDINPFRTTSNTFHPENYRWLRQ